MAGVLEKRDVVYETASEPTLGAVATRFVRTTVPRRLYQLLQLMLPVAVDAAMRGWWRTAGWSLAIAAFGAWGLADRWLAESAAENPSYARWVRGIRVVAGALAAVSAVLLAAGALGTAHAAKTQVALPDGDAARGRALFVSKGCVACHAINEIGGVSAPPLDVEFAPDEIDPLDFVARMWRGAEAMVSMQQSLFGVQLDFTGAELADIIAFAHDPSEQRKFSEADVPPAMQRLIFEQ